MKQLKLISDRLISHHIMTDNGSCCCESERAGSQHVARKNLTMTCTYNISFVDVALDNFLDERKRPRPPRPRPDWGLDFAQDAVTIIVTVFAVAWLVLFIMGIILFVRVKRLRETVAEMQATGRIRVQKLQMESDKNHAFHNPALSPDEELSRRGYSMYMPDVDVESGRGTSERQTGGQFVDELTREIDSRQQRHSSMQLQDNMDRYSRDVDSRQESRYTEPYRHESRYADPARPDSRYIDTRQSLSDSRHRDFDPRQEQRQSSAPPFLLQAIEENKRKSRLANPVANGSGRQSDTNPNFIY